MTTSAARLAMAAKNGFQVRDLTASFERSLRARNRASKTISTYLYAVHDLVRFLDRTGMPDVVTSIKREHVEAYFTDLLDRSRPAARREGAPIPALPWPQAP